MMSPITISAFAFVCVFGGALVGMFIHFRAVGAPWGQVTSARKAFVKLFSRSG